MTDISSLGHTVTACTNPRLIDRSNVEVVEAETAWNELITAAQERDRDDINSAFQKYTSACPTATYLDMENAFRGSNIPVYLIAMVRNIAPTYTIMDLQGNLDRTFVVGIFLSNKPMRPKEAAIWPESEAENLERLQNAGIVVERRIPMCTNCNELGHISKSCPQEKREITDRVVITCVNCHAQGHRIRDCELFQPALESFTNRS